MYKKNSMHWTGLLAAISTGALGGVEAAARPQAAERPNILLVFTDDHGYADLGVQGVSPEVRTPNLDQLARDGVRFTRGYATAPQCVPSRAGLMTGRHQNAFGLDDNLGGPLSHAEYTLAERLRDIGYVTGMIGKWHLEIGYKGNQPQFLMDYQPHRHGFEELFCGYMQRYLATYDLEGNTIENGPVWLEDSRYRVDIQTHAALTFLERRKEDDRPFFLYLAYYAPHSPMEDPPHYMARLAHVEEYERRMGLAALLAMDDGVGLIRRKLEEMGLTWNTLIFFMGDNGAPLREGSYIGSKNEPMIGEKGMQTDGGQRIPYLMAWPGRIPGGQVFDEMVSTLDASATTLAVAGAPLDDRIEGVDLMPWLMGEKSGPVHEALYWRWRSQAAVLTPEWKFIRLGSERSYLFDMREIGEETAETNKIKQYPEVAAKLEAMLRAKADTWATKGLPDHVVGPDRDFYDQHVERNRPPLPYGSGKTGIYNKWDPSRPSGSIFAGFENQNHKEQ